MAANGAQRDVGVVAFSQSPLVRSDTDRNEVEILMPVVGEVFEKTGLTKDDMGFTCSGSTDFIAGMSFSFVGALDAVGAWPPLSESHVEMDGAWALYEAWVRLQHGDIDTALVYSFGKSSMGDVHRVLALQLDPYLVTPLWPDAISLAALQARALIEAGKASEEDLAEVAARNRRNARANPKAQLAWDRSAADLLAEPYLANPLRLHDCPPITDGAAAVILAAGDRARELCERPAWIRAIDHRIEPHALGVRDLTESPSTRRAAEAVGVAGGSVDVVEVHAPFSHQELIVLDALGVDRAVGGGDSNGSATSINPSGGAMAANPIMSAGLIRIGEAAAAVMTGGADRAVAHATSGPCLQQNLVCLVEGE